MHVNTPADSGLFLEKVFLTAGDGKPRGVHCTDTGRVHSLRHRLFVFAQTDDVPHRKLVLCNMYSRSTVQWKSRRAVSKPPTHACTAKQGCGSAKRAWAVNSWAEIMTGEG